MKNEKKLLFINEEMDNELKKRIDVLVRVSLVKNRKRFIEEFISRNFCKFMGQDRPLTSNEVMEMLQISRATLNRRIKSQKINPINPDERIHRFLKSEVVESISSKKGGSYVR
jgi:predicted DNA-binding transcriptional regulator AlpA